MRACPGAGTLIVPEDPAALAAAMQKMLDDAAYLADCRRFATEAGKSVWNWEAHAPKLVNAIADGLAHPLK